MPHSDKTDKTKDGNLFILTGVGQLRNICGFIDQYHVTNNVAVVLYTSRNIGVVENVKKLNDGSNYFKDMQYVHLPIKLLEEEKSKSKVIYSTLENIIEDNIEKHGIKNLFLCSAGNYYYFFERICKKNHISINLLEEGLTTYRAYLEDNDKRDYRIRAKDLKSNIKKISGILYKIFLPVIRLIKAVFELLINLISFITRKNILYYVRKLINKRRKYKYGLITEFDSVTVCYPEVIKKLGVKSTNIQTLKLNYENETLDFMRGGRENILFINQKYGIRYKEHFVIVFSILKDMGINRIYFKFHPKEEEKNYLDIFEEAREKFPDLEIITLGDLNHVPVENLLNSNNITKIVGLTSSSLFYSKMVKQDIETISIAEEYKKRCYQLGVNSKRMKTFLDDYNNLMRLFPVKQFRYDEAENSLGEICRERIVL